MHYQSFSVQQTTNVCFDKKKTCVYLLDWAFFAFMTLYDFVIGRDKFGQTPYNFAKDKESRNEFRKFMGQYPDRYDYKTAQVGGRIQHI